MRCSTAVLQALMTHPKYNTEEWIIDDYKEMSKRAVKSGAFSYLMALPENYAKDMLIPEIPRILKTQRKNGMWKVKDAERISYETLNALKHSEILADLLTDFKYDPFLSFRDEMDYYGLIVRQNIMEELSQDDPAFREKLISDIMVLRKDNGSWNNTVISTSNNLNMLMDLGLSSDDSRIEQSVNWIFSMCLDDVKRHAKVLPDEVVGHHMFSNPDRSAEFQSAKEEKPEWNPVGLCYRHLPMIQTGIALKTLIRLGYENDERGHLCV